MRIKDGYELVNRDGRYFIVSENNFCTEVSASKYSVFLWKLLKENEVTKSQTLDCLLNEFDISTVLALGEIDNFLRMMRENEVVE